MHHRWLVVFILGIVLGAGCDAGLTDPNANEGDLVAHTVSYRVEGTYASCTIRYIGETGESVTVEHATLPWEVQFIVMVREKGTPFGAAVWATCADPDRLGKSVATVFVDGTMKDQGAATGFGATVRAASAVTVDG